MSLLNGTILPLQVAAMFWAISWFPDCGSSAYELQDTIHALKEENLYLHHRLENLTRALRELKHMLLDHARDGSGEHDSKALHAWNEWMQHGISTETHHLLEQAFCWPDLLNASSAVYKAPTLLFLLLMPLVLLNLLLF